jgi:hypothetical protein
MSKPSSIANIPAASDERATRFDLTDVACRTFHLACASLKHTKIPSWDEPSQFVANDASTNTAICIVSMFKPTKFFRRFEVSSHSFTSWLNCFLSDCLYLLSVI